MRVRMGFGGLFSARVEIEDVRRSVIRGMHDAAGGLHLRLIEARCAMTSDRSLKHAGMSPGELEGCWVLTLGSQHG
jgi:hypothetical protein